LGSTAKIKVNSHVHFKRRNTAAFYFFSEQTVRSKIILNPSDTDVEIFKNLRHHTNSSYFIAEGNKIIKRLLRSDLELLSIYTTEDRLEVIKPLIELHHQDADLKIFQARKEDIESIVGYSLHQGLLAAARIPKEKTLNQIFLESKRPLLFIILDQITDAENMGAIFRTSLAMNATAVIIDKKSTSPWMRRSVRVSMGALFQLPVITVDSIPECIKTLQNKNINTYATTLNDSANAIWNCDLTNDSAIVFGSEGHGIKAEIIVACENEITIPMGDSIHSLNVGTAHGIFLYEVLRQRKIKN
jgi:predicted rRNA methylase